MTLREAAQMARDAIYEGESYDYLANEVFDALETALANPPKPVAWYHPVSKRIRWDGDDLPSSWIPLYEEN